MKVKWLGHASFLITSDKGTRIVTDPYQKIDKMYYGEINETAEVVTLSHEHHDHNNPGAVKGNPRIYKGQSSEQVKDVKLSGLQVFHDVNQGKDRGKDMIICMEMDGLKVCHLGDLGHVLSDGEVAKLGKVDILMIPVGGYYTIDAATATKVVAQIKPKVTIPMHFKNDKNNFPIHPVEEFLQGKKNVTMADTSEMEFEAGKLPPQAQIIVFKPAL
jgi:L-ascorbate metabolism protein UlaG (beta-lactamase superfamily)